MKFKKIFYKIFIILFLFTFIYILRTFLSQFYFNKKTSQTNNFYNNLVNTSNNSLSNSNNNSLNLTINQNNIPKNEFQNNLKTLSELAINYNNSHHLQLCLQFIRRNKYNSNSWKLAAGSIDMDFVNYVKENSPEVYDYNFENFSITDNKNTNLVDFIHLCATLNSYILLGDCSLSRFSGWAGDLTTLTSQVILHNSNNDLPYENLLEFSKSLLGANETSKKSSFGISDLIADIDSYNLYNNFNKDKTISFYDLIYNYYFNNDTKQYLTREIDFKTNLEKSAHKSLENLIKETFSGIINSSIVKQIMNEDCYSKYYNNFEFYNKIMANTFSCYFEKY